MNVITRIPPSPTGMFHVGSLRTALYDYLVAKKHNGKFLLRIEDTDRKRFVEGGTENIIQSLYWAGIRPDEGVMFDNNENIINVGEDGPYIQSDRLEIYKPFAQKLLDNGHAYYAFDTAEELTSMRESQQAQKLPVRYDRNTMNNEFTLGKEKALEMVKNGVPHVIRMKISEGEPISFNDLVRGTVTFERKEVDDQILMKSDGYPTYHLAVVVDDHHMKVTHIIRGEEWLSSTPKHILLYEMLDFPLPKFAHLPLLVNEQKRKLSKRHGDVSVEDFKKKGYLPEAMINFVAFLGWNPGTEQEIFSLDELVQAFSIEKVQKSPAFFDRDKLDWYNQQYIRKMDENKLLDLTIPFLIESNIISQEEANNKREWLKSVIRLQKERVRNLSEFSEAISFIFEVPSYDKELLMWKKADLTDAKEKLSLIYDFLENINENSWKEEEIKETVVAWIKENELGVGNVLWPTRVALSGQKNSPGPFEIMEVLGKNETLLRIDKAKNIL